MPENFSPVKRAYLRGPPRPVGARGARWSPPSASTPATSCGRRLGVPDAPRRGHPAGGRSRPAAARRSGPGERSTSSARYGLDRPWFLYPAITYPHKNHATLVRALAAGARRPAGPHRGRGPVGGRASWPLAARPGRRRPGPAHRAHRPAPTSTLSTVAPWPAPSPPASRASASRCWRRWRGAARSSPPTPPRCPSVVGSAGELVRAGRPGGVGGGHGAGLLADDARRAELVDGRPASGWRGGPRTASAGQARRPPGSGRQAYRADAHPRPLPPLRARHRAHRQGDDPHRPGARRPRPPAPRRHRLPWYQPPRRRAGLGAASSSATTTSRGGASPGCTRSPPTSATSPPGPLAFGGFTAEAAVAAALTRRRPDVVLAMSPPLTLGLAGLAVGRGCAGRRSCSTSRTSSPTSPSRSATSPTRGSSPPPPGSSAGATRLPTPSPCCPTTCATTSWPSCAGRRRGDADKVRVIPNFVDTDRHRARTRRRARTAGSSAWSAGRWCCTPATSASARASTWCVEAARRLRDRRPDVVFVDQRRRQRPGLARGGGGRRGLPNVRFGDIQPAERLPDVLADRRHPPRAAQGGPGQGQRAVEAVLDPRRRPARCSPPSTRAPRWPAPSRPPAPASRCRPTTPTPSAPASDALLDDPDGAAAMGERGRRFVEGWASPAAVAGRYEALFEELARGHRARADPPSGSRPGAASLALRALERKGTTEHGQGVVGEEGRTGGPRRWYAPSGPASPPRLPAADRRHRRDRRRPARRLRPVDTARPTPRPARRPTRSPTTGTPPSASTSATASSSTAPPRAGRSSPTCSDDPLGHPHPRDGVIHIHPFIDAAGGRNARMRIFFDDVGAPGQRLHGRPSPTARCGTRARPPAPSTARRARPDRARPLEQRPGRRRRRAAERDHHRGLRRHAVPERPRVLHAGLPARGRARRRSRSGPT